MVVVALVVVVGEIGNNHSAITKEEQRENNMKGFLII